MNLSMIREVWRETKAKVAETRRLSANLSRLLNRSLDYMLLQEIVNSCPDDVEMRVGPLGDGSFIYIRRTYPDEPGKKKADPRYRESVLENDIMAEIKKTGKTL